MNTSDDHHDTYINTNDNVENEEQSDRMESSAVEDCNSSEEDVYDIFVDNFGGLKDMIERKECDAEEVCLIIMIFAFRHHLSNVAIDHYIKTLHFILPQKVVPSSFYALRQRLCLSDDNECKIYYNCNYCLCSLSDRDTVCQTEGCLGSKKMDVGMNAIYDINTIIQKLLHRPTFREGRLYKNTRPVCPDHELRDIQDGEKWKSNKEVYNDASNIVMGISTDGVPGYHYTKAAAEAYGLYGLYTMIYLQKVDISGII
eukprot:Pompholyxophrys_sp_v1_NODE_59_length_2791_cov_2.606360.p2 type:complete len:257 gc:universal NODE_59_length_2791_cov_2.606360:891-1661(+)